MRYRGERRERIARFAAYTPVSILLSTTHAFMRSIGPRAVLYQKKIYRVFAARLCSWLHSSHGALFRMTSYTSNGDRVVREKLS